MNDTNKERADFEAWLDPAWSRDTFADDDGDTLYVEDWVQGAWMMFCHNRASLAAKPPAAEPVAWPKDAAEVRQFMESNFISAEFVGSDESPNDDDRYLLSAHDFLSAVEWWTGFATAAPPHGAANKDES